MAAAEAEARTVGLYAVTVMTAIVVIALLVVFREQVLDAVRNAFQDVRNSGNGQDT